MSEMNGLFRRNGSFLRTEPVFAVFLVAGACLRLLVSITYMPALMLQRDSYAYLNQALGAGPSGGFRPAVYPLILKLLLLGHNVAVVAITQHIIGLGLAIGIYVLLRRGGVGSVLAALGTAPLLLDPYQVDIEQYVLTETIFELLAVTAIALLLYRPIPPTPALVGSGLLLVLAGLTRYAGLVLILPAVALVLVTRVGAMKIFVLIVAFLLPLIVYSVFGPSISSGGPGGRIGFFMFGRVLPFAECPRFDTSPKVKKLFCPGNALAGHRNEGYFAMKDLLGNMIHSQTAERTLLSFSLHTIAHQPVDYLAAVGTDFGRYFDLTGPQAEERFAVKWRFVETIDQSQPLPYITDRQGSPPRQLGFRQRFTIDRGLASKLWYYQQHIYTWGPLLGLLILLGFGGGVLGRNHPAGIARVAGTMAACAGLLALFPVAVTVYHVRYAIPVLPFAGCAGAAGAGALIDRFRPKPPGASVRAPWLQRARSG